MPWPFHVPSKTRESGIPWRVKTPELLLLLRASASETDRVSIPKNPVIPGLKKSVSVRRMTMKERGIIQEGVVGLAKCVPEDCARR